MKKTIRTIVFCTFIFTFFVASVEASTVVRTGEKVSLSEEQVVEGDFYAVAGPVLLSGDILGDAHIIGGSVTTNGEIGADLFVVGGAVQVHASVTDDVRVVGGEVTLAEYVGGDVFVIGGVLTILSTAHVEGDVFFYGGEGEINGEVIGGVHGITEKLRIDGAVRGDVDVQTGSLLLGDRADIGGNIQYRSPADLIRSQEAIVVGEVTRSELPQANADPREMLVPFLIYAFSVLILFAVFRRNMQHILESTITHFTRNGLIGLAGTIFIPGLVILSFVTVIGSVIGFAVLFASIALWITSVLLLGVLAGLLMLRVMHKPNEIALLPTLGGIAAVCIISLIPVIGPVMLMVVTFAIFGSLLHLIYTKIA